MRPYDADFISAKDAMTYLKLKDPRALDAFVVKHKIPLLRDGKGKHDYRVNGAVLQEVVMATMAYQLTRVRSKPINPKLTAWRRANGLLLATKNKMEAATTEAIRNKHRAALGGLTKNVRSAREEWEATADYKKIKARQTKKKK